ncbi:WG repeat-containing protein [Flagellimonas amoyensis]|uniref:WG repeat-containing protein n=1 Tax=Flagellimonas amoyensis TaxID=2169401 RepID=UPI000D3B3C36|nr:WG repeat-containing protein [Allomuricauda amoyensis]
MKHRFSFLFLIISLAVSHAQNDSELAKSFFSRAEKEYGDKNFAASLDYLQKVSEYLRGSTYSKVEFLYVMNYYKTKKYKEANQHVKRFFNENPSSSSSMYIEIMEILPDLKSYADEIERREREQAEAAERERIRREKEAEAAAERQRIRKEEETQKIQMQLEQGIKPDKYHYVGSFTPEGLAVIQSEQSRKYGYVDKTAKEVVPPEYEEAEDFKEGFAKVKLNGKWGLIDPTGWQMTPFKYDEISFFANDMAAVMLNHKWGFVNIAGEETVPLVYDEVHYFKNGLTTVTKNNKKALINKVGKELTAFKYDTIYSYYEGMAAVSINGKYGFIDTSGKEVIPLIYDDHEPFKGPFAKVKLDGKWFLIDKNGKGL